MSSRQSGKKSTRISGIAGTSCRGARLALSSEPQPARQGAGRFFTAPMIPSPALTDPATVPALLRGQGYAVLSPQAVCSLTDSQLADLQALGPSWDGLPPDNYLKDGGHYRRRRHSCFVV